MMMIIRVQRMLTPGITKLLCCFLLLFPFVGSAHADHGFCFTSLYLHPYFEGDPFNSLMDGQSATEPTAQPTGLYFSVTGTGPYTFSGSFTASASATGYLVVRKAVTAPTLIPVDGTSYSTGSQMGGDIVYAGSALSFTDAGVSADVTYHYAIYAFNGSGATTNYLTSSPLTGTSIARTSASGAITASTGASSVSFPGSGISVSFPAGNSGTTISVVKNNLAPTSNIQVNAAIRTMKAMYFSVSSVSASPGNYTAVLDFSSLGTFTTAEWSGFKVMKRANATSPWVDVTSLGAVIIQRQTDGTAGKITVSGLTDFGEFGLGEAYDGVLVSNLSATVEYYWRTTDWDHNAQSFITDGKRYQLSKVKLALDDPSEAPNLRIRLYGSSVGGNVNVSSLLTSFSNPVLVSGNIFEVTPQIAVKLEPNTQYWVVMYTLPGTSVDLQFTRSVTTTGPGSFPTNMSAYSTDAGSSFGLSNTDPIMFAVEATQISRTWTGNASTSWSNANNWAPTETPAIGETLTIPNRDKDPVLDQSVSVMNLNMEAGAVLQVADKTLSLSQGLTINGTIQATTGNVSLSGSSVQGIIGNGTIRNLQVNNASGAVISSGNHMLTITGTLTPTAGTLMTHGNLTLRSDADGTARVAAGSSTGGYVIGDVITQRYLSKRTGTGRNGRAWRLVSIPVTGSGTLRDFFMGGRSGADLTVLNNRNAEPANLGTVVIGHNYANAGAANAAGFDWIGVSNQVSSLRRYVANATSGSFASSQVPVMTTTYGSADQGYMLFARGDRQQQYNGTVFSSATTLQATGGLKQGTQTITIPPRSSAGYALVGNPYMAVLDMEKVYIDNAGIIGTTIYVWDANSDGNVLKQGGYRTITRTGTGSWSATGAGSNPQYLESGTAFFVQPSVTGGSLLIKESHKVSGTPGIAPHGSLTGDPSRLFLNLEVTDTGSRRLVDGAVVFFDGKYHDVPGDDVDIEAMSNISAGSIGIRQLGKRLAMEGREWPKDTAARSIPVDMRNLGDDAYVLRIIPALMEKEGFTAYLNDRHLGKEININTGAETIYSFRRTGVPDIDTGRFEIVYRMKQTAVMGSVTPDDASSAAKPRLYPNPAKAADVKLSLGGMHFGIYRVAIHDGSGRLVNTQAVDHKTPGSVYPILQGRKLPAGRYLVRVTSNDGTLHTMQLMLD